MEENAKNIQENSPAQGQVPGSRAVPDTPTMNDSKANVAKDDLVQGTVDRELNPEYGDAADSTSEKLGTDSRDDASPQKT